MLLLSQNFGVCQLPPPPYNFRPPSREARTNNKEHVWGAEPFLVMREILFLLVLDACALKVSNNIAYSGLNQINLVLDRSTFIHTSSSLAVTICVSGSSWGGRGGSS